MMMRVLDVGGTFGFGCESIFRNSPNVQVIRPTKDLTQIQEMLPLVNLVVFGGGADIDPSLYHHSNVASDVNPSRDKFEKEVFKMSLASKVYRLGICRGAQLLCALNGGWLVQHIDGHAGAGDHEVICYNMADAFGSKKSIKTNSCHHQMMVPSERHSILAYTENRTKEFVYDTNSVGFKTNFNYEINVEAALFSGRDIGFQWHPEWMPPESDGCSIVRKALKYYFELDC